MKTKRFLFLLLLLVLSLSLTVTASAAEASACATVQIGSQSTEYTSFEKAWNAAVDAAGSGKEVVFKLLKDWTANSDGSFGSGSGFDNGAIRYNKSKNITLDLNGCCIDRNIYTPVDHGAVIYVTSELTIIDSKPDEYSCSKLVKGGVITGGASSGTGGGICVTDNGKLNFNGGTILSCVTTDDGGAIGVSGVNAVLNVDGGAFYGNRVYDAALECCGGAVFAYESTVTIKNAVFEGNYTEDDGGAIYILKATLDISDSRFYSNQSLEEGGAIMLSTSAKATIDNCVFVKNKAGEDGGAIDIISSEGTYISGCKMYYNTTGECGGAVSVYGDRVFVNGGEYMYNSAAEFGGGIYVDSMYDINAMGKLIIRDNTVNGKASNLCLQNGNFSTAYLYCGGFYEGSYVSIGSTDKNSRLAIVGIDTFQYDKYIDFDDGFKADKLEEHQTSAMDISAEGSAVGNGNIFIIIALAVLALAAAITVVLYTKRKKEGAVSDEK